MPLKSSANEFSAFVGDANIKSKKVELAEGLSSKYMTDDLAPISKLAVSPVSSPQPTQQEVKISAKSHKSQSKPRKWSDLPQPAQLALKRKIAAAETAQTLGTVAVKLPPSITSLPVKAHFLTTREATKVQQYNVAAEATTAFDPKLTVTPTALDQKLHDDYIAIFNAESMKIQDAQSKNGKGDVSKRVKAAVGVSTYEQLHVNDNVPTQLEPNNIREITDPNAYLMMSVITTKPQSIHKEVSPSEAAAVSKEKESRTNARNVPSTVLNSEVSVLKPDDRHRRRRTLCIIVFVVLFVLIGATVVTVVILKNAHVF